MVVWYEGLEAVVLPERSIRATTCPGAAQRGRGSHKIPRQNECVEKT